MSVVTLAWPWAPTPIIRLATSVRRWGTRKTPHDIRAVRTVIDTMEKLTIKYKYMLKTLPKVLCLICRITSVYTSDVASYEAYKAFRIRTLQENIWYSFLTTSKCEITKEMPSPFRSATQCISSKWGCLKKVCALTEGMEATRSKSTQRTTHIRDQGFLYLIKSHWLR